MKILNEEEVNLLKELAIGEAGLINIGFNESKHLGLMFLSNALTSFEENYLKPRYGNIITSFSSEYRVLLVEILKNIDDLYKSDILSEILIPKVKKISEEEAFDFIRILRCQRIVIT